MRESEKEVDSICNFDAICKHIFESLVKYPILGNSRAESDRLAILVTELHSNEVIVMIRIFPKNAVVAFRFGAI